MAAVSLPAFSATQPVESTLSVGVSNYSESDVPQSDIVAGDDERYDIDIRQFKLVTPVGRQWSVELGVARETMSGASPWATVGGPDGEPDLIMSGATIKDSRTQVDASVVHYGENRSTALTLSRSKEDDYTAFAVSLVGEWSFNNDLTTLSIGASHSKDMIEPSDAEVFGRVVRKRKRTRSVSFGLGQVLDRNSALHAGLDIIDHTGYLSDPYKLRDARPGNRLGGALSLRYRRHVPEANASLHLDYRYYHDTWGVGAHTLRFAWYQNLGRRFQFVPSLRYHSQSEADFFLPVDDFLRPPDARQSSDFRLSAYGAATLGVKGILRLPRWTLTAGLDRYTASESYGLASGSEHPARLGFTLASVVLDFRF